MVRPCRRPCPAKAGRRLTHLDKVLETVQPLGLRDPNRILAPNRLLPVSPVRLQQPLPVFKQGLLLAQRLRLRVSLGDDLGGFGEEGRGRKVGGTNAAVQL